MTHGGNVWDGNPQDWLDFSANLRPGGPPEWVQRVLLRSLSDVRYYPDRSMRAARHGLARYLRLDESQVLPTAGGAAAIDLVLSAGTGRVLIAPPTFGEYAARAVVHGRAVVPSMALPQQGDTLVLCNPNNPDGRVLPVPAVLEMADRARAADACLMVDEAFIDFAPEHSVRRHVHPGLLITGSLTKVLCIPGIRLGYIAGDAGSIASFSQRMLPWPICAQAAAIAAALPDHLQELQADRADNDRRRAAFVRQLETLGAMVAPSAANFVLARFPRPMQDAVLHLKQRGILVRDCASFGLDARYLRLAVRLEEENAQLIAELEKALQC